MTDLSAIRTQQMKLLRKGALTPSARSPIIRTARHLLPCLRANEDRWLMTEPKDRPRRSGFHDLHVRIPMRLHEGISEIAEYQGERYNTIVRRAIEEFLAGSLRHSDIRRTGADDGLLVTERRMSRR